MSDFPPLDWQDVARRRIGRLGDPLIYRASVDSTNTLAAALARYAAPVGAVIVADHQTAGRGRLGRPWVAAPNTGLACTVVLASPDPVWTAPMVVGLAVLDTLRGLGLPATLKWPNDALILGRKCSGILIEARSMDGAPRLLAGIGINVFSSDSSLPNATHIAAHSARTPRREDILVNLLTNIEQWEARAIEDPARVRTAWSSRLETIGREVTIHTGTGVLRGAAVGVSEDGGLLVSQANGATVVIQAGDVTLSAASAGSVNEEPEP
jgi:BirA family transcriptional regulator, biotin operon repressor / biotin---[acetyl-CoA-carboxylase] ligase